MIPQELILKTERYCYSVDFNQKTFWIALAVVFVIALAIGVIIGLHDFSDYWRWLFPMILTLMVTLFSALVLAILCTTEQIGVTTYKDQYYVSVTDFKQLPDEITDNYYIHEQDGNMLIIREVVNETN